MKAGIEAGEKITSSCRESSRETIRKKRLSFSKIQLLIRREELVSDSTYLNPITESEKRRVACYE